MYIRDKGRLYYLQLIQTKLVISLGAVILGLPEEFYLMEVLRVLPPMRMLDLMVLTKKRGNLKYG